MGRLGSAASARTCSHGARPVLGCYLRLTKQNNLDSPRAMATLGGALLSNGRPGQRAAAVWLRDWLPSRSAAAGLHRAAYQLIGPGADDRMQSILMDRIATWPTLVTQVIARRALVRPQRSTPRPAEIGSARQRNVAPVGREAGVECGILFYVYFSLSLSLSFFLSFFRSVAPLPAALFGRLQVGCGQVSTARVVALVCG